MATAPSGSASTICGAATSCGEMGLVRHVERTADVVAATPVEVLSVNQRFLDRVQRRYPRIASQVFLNLSRILSDKLEKTSRQVVAARAAG